MRTNYIWLFQILYLGYLECALHKRPQQDHYNNDELEKRIIWESMDGWMDGWVKVLFIISFGLQLNASLLTAALRSTYSHSFASSGGAREGTDGWMNQFFGWASAETSCCKHGKTTEKDERVWSLCLHARSISFISGSFHLKGIFMKDYWFLVIIIPSPLH